jgi:hypothetical protein
MGKKLLVALAMEGEFASERDTRSATAIVPVLGITKEPYGPTEERRRSVTRLFPWIQPFAM